MKAVLRQDAEQINPMVDQEDLFNSGIGWHLPVRLKIIQKTSVFPHKIALCLRFHLLQRPESAEGHVTFSTSLCWQAQLLAFQNFGDI